MSPIIRIKKRLLGMVSRLATQARTNAGRVPSKTNHLHNRYTLKFMVNAFRILCLSFRFGIWILFTEPSKPEIEDTNLVGDELKLSLGEPFRMFCNIVGLPDPDVSWYKNGLLIENETRISISPDHQTLDIKYLKIEDDGEFKCVGVNRMGSVEKLTNLKITSKHLSCSLQIEIS